jgi:predicted DCC family thiol-disulfide oxidoreductase YuxK
MTPLNHPRPAAPNGWVLYDGECGFCLRWAGFWKATLERRGFAVDALQSDWVAQQLDMPIEELLHDIRLLNPDGTLVSGADVYLSVMRRFWLVWPLYVLFRLPGFNAIMKFGYRWFAKNRYCISGQCRL